MKNIKYNWEANPEHIHCLGFRQNLRNNLYCMHIGHKNYYLTTSEK